MDDQSTDCNKRGETYSALQKARYESEIGYHGGSHGNGESRIENYRQTVSIPSRHSRMYMMHALHEAFGWHVASELESPNNSLLGFS